MFGKQAGIFDHTCQELRALKQFYPTRANRNYPFRSPSTTLWTKDHIRAVVPPCDVADGYVENYINTFEKTHCMLHVPTFRQEIELFWRSPSTLSYEWLSQFLMVLALGCPRSERVAHPGLVDSLLDGAEACLMQSQFLAKPSLTSIRVMAMMTIAKQIDIVAFDDSDGVWAFLGLVIRLAMSIGLHRDPRWFGTMSPLEAEMRKRIWTTLVFMDSHNSLESGQPPLLQADDYDSAPPTGRRDQDLTDDSTGDASSDNSKDPEPTSNTPCDFLHEVNESTFQTILWKSFPDVLRIIRLVHLPQDDRQCRAILEAEVKIRELRRIAGTLYQTYATCNSDRSGTLLWKDLQGITLEIYFRRVLLALHQPYFMGPDAAKWHVAACRSVLESALAILVLQRTLYDETETADPISIEWFAELFKGDFFVAALFVAVGIRRNGFSPERKPSSSGSDRLAEIDIASQTLDACWSIWGSKVGLSVHHFKAHLLLGIVISATKSLDSQVPSSLRIQDAIDTTIATVKAAMSRKDGSETQPAHDSTMTRIWDAGASTMQNAPPIHTAMSQSPGEHNNTEQSYLVSCLPLERASAERQNRRLTAR